MPEITSFSKDVREFEYRRGDDVLKLWINVDALTEAYYRGIGERQSARLRVKGSEISKLDEIQITPEEGSEDKPFTGEDAAKFVQQVFERAAESVGEEKSLCADMLAHGLLIDWDVTLNGEKIPPSEDNLKEYLSLRALNELRTFCLEKCKTVVTREDLEPEERKKGSFSRA